MERKIKSIFDAIQINKTAEVRKRMTGEFYNLQASVGGVLFNPLQYACKCHNSEIVKIFLAHPKGRVDAVGSKNSPTPLLIACQNLGQDDFKEFYVDIVRTLIQHGADLEAKTPSRSRKDWRPIHYAAEHNNYRVFAMLVQAGAKIRRNTSLFQNLKNIVGKKDNFPEEALEGIFDNHKTEKSCRKIYSLYRWVKGGGTPLAWAENQKDVVLQRLLLTLKQNMPAHQNIVRRTLARISNWRAGTLEHLQLLGYTQQGGTQVMTYQLDANEPTRENVGEQNIAENIVLPGDPYRLVFSDKLINQAQATKFASLIRTGLWETVRFSNNFFNRRSPRIKAEILKIIFDAVASSSVKVFEFEDNFLTNEEAVGLAQAFEKIPNATLRVVKIKANLLTDLGAEAIIRGFKDTQITDLDLSRNLITAQASTDLLVSALRDGSPLVRVDLSHNKIVTQGAKKLKQVITTNFKLEMLKLDENPISLEGYKKLAKAIDKSTPIIGSGLKYPIVNVPFGDDISEATQKNVFRGLITQEGEIEARAFNEFLIAASKIEAAVRRNNSRQGAGVVNAGAQSDASTMTEAQISQEDPVSSQKATAETGASAANIAAMPRQAGPGFFQAGLGRDARRQTPDTQQKVEALLTLARGSQDHVRRACEFITFLCTGDEDKRREAQEISDLLKGRSDTEAAVLVALFNAGLSRPGVANREQ
ncbi:MAG TPA: ankyrin repeat domain-containing protein [Gammaproteobacteria bacterium]|nr:ankyrin repeat domain-containing protein [Gammaproteobacteria bacterium]